MSTRSPQPLYWHPSREGVGSGKTTNTTTSGLAVAAPATTGESHTTGAGTSTEGRRATTPGGSAGGRPRRTPLPSVHVQTSSSSSPQQQQHHTMARSSAAGHGTRASPNVVRWANSSRRGSVSAAGSGSGGGTALPSSRQQQSQQQRKSPLRTTVSASGAHSHGAGHPQRMSPTPAPTSARKPVDTAATAGAKKSLTPQQQQQTNVICTGEEANSTKDNEEQPQPSSSETGVPGEGQEVIAPARSPLTRPAYALSVGIMQVYQGINNKFYLEQRSRGNLGGQQTFNNGYDDVEGHYIHIVGERIADRYTVQGVLGKGSFGTVLLCCDEKYQEDVAVKVIRSGAYFEAQGRLEMDIVLYLNQKAELQNLVMMLRKAFYWQGHIVLVFELLSYNLYELIKCTHYNGVSLDLTRKFAFQLLQVLYQLDTHRPRIIHCDIKPENVVLKDRKRSGIRVIDFGSACYQLRPEWEMPPPLTPLGDGLPAAGRRVHFDQENEQRGRSAGRGAQHGAVATAPAQPPHAALSSSAHQPQPPSQVLCKSQKHPSFHKMPRYIQSRFYRSPEVILELGYTTAIDRWSLGCMVVELHTGVPLFPGLNETEMISLFTAVLGPLPDEMIAASPKFHLFYIDKRVEGMATVTTPTRDGAADGSGNVAGSSRVAAAGTLAPRLAHPVTAAASATTTVTTTEARAATALASESSTGAYGSSGSRRGQGPSTLSGTAAAAASTRTAASGSDVGRATATASLATDHAGSRGGHVRRAATANPIAPNAAATTTGALGTAVGQRSEGSATGPVQPASATSKAGSPPQPPPIASASSDQTSSATADGGDPVSAETQAAHSLSAQEPPQQHEHGQDNPCGHQRQQQQYGGVIERPHTHFSPFALRHTPKPEWCRSLEDIIGVHTGGPRGCRQGQAGHDTAAYEAFLSFVKGLLAYDPRERTGCADALEHPFLAPLKELERQAAAAAAATVASASGTTSSATQ